MAQQKTSGQTTPKAPNLGRASHKTGSPNVTKGRPVKASSGKNASMGVKTGTTYGNHNVAHPC